MFGNFFSFLSPETEVVSDSSTLERHRKDLVSVNLDSLVNIPQNSILQNVNSCLPAVPSIDLGSGAASHSSDNIHVINSKTFSTSAPQTPARFTSLEQNGNEAKYVLPFFLHLHPVIFHVYERKYVVTLKFV